MTASITGRHLIQMFEGFAPSAYKDPNGIPTIGYGHTLNVKMGDQCLAWEADQFLAADLKVAEMAVNHMVRVPLTQNQFDALVSLVFNIGSGNFHNSTVLRELNGMHYEAAAAAILMWNRCAGKVSPGLQRRREAERALFMAAPKLG